jgi:hypothetical protein
VVKPISVIYSETLISISDMNGKELLHRIFQNQNTMELNIGSFTAGIYLVKIQTKAGVESRKLVIQK